MTQVFKKIAAIALRTSKNKINKKNKEEGTCFSCSSTDIFRESGLCKNCFKDKVDNKPLMDQSDVIHMKNYLQKRFSLSPKTMKALEEDALCFGCMRNAYDVSPNEYDSLNFSLTGLCRDCYSAIPKWTCPSCEHDENLEGDDRCNHCRTILKKP
jgi:hypothetical protein